MSKTCLVCKKQHIPRHDTRSFHKFPMNNEMKKQWMSAIGATQVPKHAAICSDHFDEHSYHQTDGYTHIRRLLSNAVPSINLNVNLHPNHDVITSEIKYEPVECKRECINDIGISNDKDWINEAHNTNDSGKHSLITGIYGHSGSTKQSGNIENGRTLYAVERSSLNAAILDNNCTPKGGLKLRNINDLVSIKNERQYSYTSQESKINQNSVADESSVSSDPNGRVITAHRSNGNRKRPEYKEESTVSKKKFRFMDGFKTLYISREDFVSDEAWQRFVRVMTIKKLQHNALIQKNYRKRVKINRVKQLVSHLKEKKTYSAADSLEADITLTKN